MAKANWVIKSMILLCTVSLSTMAWGQDALHGPARGQASGALSNLRVEEAVICEKVVDRQPVGRSEVFARGSGQVYCFTHIEGATAQTHIVHNWYYQGGLKASVQLPVKSSNWRTWSIKSIDPERTGEWMVEILSEKGEPLESVIFFVQ